MDNEIFSNIGKIIERGKKSSTYKYALLRGTIDIIQENSPYISFQKDRVFIPLGLLLEKWIIYYYPLYQLKDIIPQNTSKKSSFQQKLKNLINFYDSKGGFSAFYNDLRNKSIPIDFRLEFFELLKTILTTITGMPMKHLGFSVSKNHYSIFIPHKKKIQKANYLKYGEIENIIEDFGAFSLPVEYYQIFKLLGSFVNGQDSILFKWAEFSSKTSGDYFSVNKVLNELLKSPVTKRNITESKKLYTDILNKKGMFYCVWTGKKLTSLSETNIDHMIPFSIWKNNDLWNLMPSTPNINSKKRDKIPTPEIIERQKELILNYWGIIYENQARRFQKELQVSLLGNNSFDSWKRIGISQLQNSCDYLIENRGFDEWKI